MMYRRRISWSLSLLALAACHARAPSKPPVAATPEPPAAADIDEADPSPATLGAIEPFVGEYAYVGGDAQRRSALAALDGALEGLDPISRITAQRKLSERDPAIPLIAIGFVDGQTSITRFDVIVRAPLDGEPVTVTHNGRAAKVTHRLENRPLQLVEILEGQRGRTVNTFVLSEDGRDLTVTTHIEGNHMSTPVVYELDYLRR